MPNMPITSTNNPGGASSVASSTLVKALLIIAIIGALNWGLVGFFEFNLVHAIFGGAAPEQPSLASRVIYMIVGLAGLVSAIMFPRLNVEARHRTH